MWNPSRSDRMDSGSIDLVTVDLATSEFRDKHRRVHGALFLGEIHEGLQKTAGHFGDVAQFEVLRCLGNFGCLLGRIILWPVVRCRSFCICRTLFLYRCSPLVCANS